MTATALLGATILLIGGWQAAADGLDVLWPEKPIRVDRASQTYERLPALKREIDDRIWVVVPQRIQVIDSARFSHDGKTFRIDHIVQAVQPKRLCSGGDGTRWGCGRMATIVLSNLVRGKKLLCDVTTGESETLLSRCQLGTRDIAGEIIAAGFGRTGHDSPLQSVEELARRKKAGLWRNPACIADFDRC